MKGGIKEEISLPISNLYQTSLFEDKDKYIFSCPYSECGLGILVHKNEICCQLFVHAIDKVTFSPINPHINKEEMDKLIEGKKILGCGKAFFFDGKNLSLRNYG